MKIQHFYDQETSTFTYILIDDVAKRCAIIDSVMGYDLYSGRVDNKNADLIINYIKSNNLTLDWILETHAHADHLTASSYIKDKIGGKIGIGKNIIEVIKFWVPIFNNAKNTPVDGSQFDYLFKDNELFFVGNLAIKVLYTPGHTPACVSYLVEDSIFVGDTIFNPKMGTARVDFPGGSAKNLYNSIQKIFSLPDETKIFVGHDYPENGEDPRCSYTVIEQKNDNILVNQNISEDQYIEARTKRDLGKAVPKLIMPSMQVNIRAGRFTPCEENGVQYLKIPINKL
jgi:glyoxylase-like metal-dependent hydrolase (beta-lactamase superfamily II)